ncbi:hypothetical protein [Stieleria mannarensis]|uniref:hypothetical protein n=1 Tax=Stieleria mannarensis TaxID=2755585 RepID=UPI001600455E|nr:hypothetical protein [Rhodopirellula sp. JC639]
MPSDEEIARRSLDLQKRARDVPLTQIPGYMEWSKQKLADGVSDALIAHLDATSMWLLPEDVNSVSTDDFDEMLDDLKSTAEDTD